MPLILSGSAGLSGNVGNVTKDMLPAGSVLQVVQAVYKDSITYNATGLITWPISASITPAAASSKILVLFNSWIQPNSELYQQVYLYRNGSRLVDAANNSTTGSSQGGYVGGVAGLSQGSNNSSNQGLPCTFEFLDSPNTTSQVSYDVRSQASNSLYCSFSINKNSSAWSQAGITTMTLMEIKA